MYGNETTLDDLKQAVYSATHVIAEKHMERRSHQGDGEIQAEGWHLLLSSGVTLSIQALEGGKVSEGVEVYAWRGKISNPVMGDPLMMATRDQIVALAEFYGIN